jgi:hypothetical protein
MARRSSFISMTALRVRLTSLIARNEQGLAMQRSPPGQALP